MKVKILIGILMRMVLLYLRLHQIRVKMMVNIIQVVMVNMMDSIVFAHYAEMKSTKT